MHMSDEREIAAPVAEVWAALLSADTLTACVPGAKEVTGNAEDGFEATVVQKVGPVKATFKGNVVLSNLVEGESLTLTGEGKGGAAGFAKGGADVKLAATEVGTLLSYEVDAKVGGKLAQLLNEARTAVTVNSTAGQQVLWRGIPLKVFGRAVYAKPEFVSTQPLTEFFAAAARPDNRAYKDYRRYLLETSQLSGGFYSRKGRRQLLRQVVDMMLSADDPYDALKSGTAAPRQQLRVVN